MAAGCLGNRREENGTESSCNINEGIKKFETIGGGFANEVIDEWFSQFTKELCNFVLNNKFVIPIQVLFHYTYTNRYINQDIIEQY